jgi:hypothetical protein
MVFPLKMVIFHLPEGIPLISQLPSPSLSSDRRLAAAWRSGVGDQTHHPCPCRWDETCNERLEAGTLKHFNKYRIRITMNN